MDEIICPECGRPNLVEAEKCWYCQIPLAHNKDKEKLAEETPDSNADFSDVENTKTKLPGNEETDGNIPEWLKRIRELKKADQPVEEVDQWQQEKLFSGLAQEKDFLTEHTGVASRPVRSHDVPDPKPVISESQPLLEEAPAEENLEEEMNLEKIEPDDPEDELPEGFTPLEL